MKVSNQKSEPLERIKLTEIFNPFRGFGKAMNQTPENKEKTKEIEEAKKKGSGAL